MARTFTVSSTGRLTSNVNHGLHLGEKIRLSHLAGGTPPPAESAVTVYVVYAGSPMTDRDFWVSLTKDGTHIGVAIGLTGKFGRISAGKALHPSGAHP